MHLFHLKYLSVDTILCWGNSLQNSAKYLASALLIDLQVTPEAKKKAADAKARGDEAFKRKDYTTAVDAYTQVLVRLIGFLFNSHLLPPPPLLKHMRKGKRKQKIMMNGCNYPLHGASIWIRF